MVKIYINNKVVFVPKNTSILEACEVIGVQIPRFCYHERLKVSGNCRMCLVEVEKTPKPVTACAFPVVPEMKVFTDTPLVRKARENVLEFLLLNHPLDCPICDQGGECDLQEQAFAYGTDRSRFVFKKRTNQDKKAGPLIKTIMSRCILCTRCVRFLQDIAGEVNFGTTLRGVDTEIGAYVKTNLNTELSGNIIDLCPVGALTGRPYAFVARPWEISAVDTVDVMDSFGANIRVNVKETEILRILPLQNDSLNEEWISDKTRFSFDGLRFQRIATPFGRGTTSAQPLTWEKALKRALSAQQLSKASEMLLVCGNNASLETSQILQKIGQTLGIPVISEQFAAQDSSLVFMSQLNVPVASIAESDLVVTLGANVRMEASLLNIRLKNRFNEGNFVKASIGVGENDTYKTVSLGHSLSVLCQIAEGRHPFCKQFLKAKKPLLIIGTAVTKRVDAAAIFGCVGTLKRFTNLTGGSWFGLGVLPLFAGSVGTRYAGIASNTLQALRSKKFVLGVGLDSYQTLVTKIPTSCFLIALAAFSEASLTQANVVLPSVSSFEISETFLNLEGRAQKTTAGLKGPNLARPESQILKTLFQGQAGSLDLPTPRGFGEFEKNGDSFLKALTFRGPAYSQKFFKTPLRPAFSNCYVTNAVSKNSLVMARCFTRFKQTYSNFI